MKKPITVALVLLGLAGMTFGQVMPSPESEIRAVLDLQQAAWNRGDIEGFMAYYWKSDDLTFQSGNSRTQGWSGVLARYKKTYPPDKMGRLEFTDLALRILSRDAAFVLGRFKLDQGGTLKEGVFTLIFRRTGQGWRIVHDHTSSQ
jgi:beta-aspartyl-peptidase (threonine type)